MGARFILCVDLSRANGLISNKADSGVTMRGALRALAYWMLLPLRVRGCLSF